MNSLISQLIRSCHGYVYETAGIISGFFDDPSEARSCALCITSKFQKQVEVCGCEIVITR
jgi:hypothetical protein